MSAQPGESRLAARAVRDLAAAVAAEFITAFRFANPDWYDSLSDRGRAATLEDTRYNLDFLAGAVEIDSRAAFADYVRWTRRVLDARGVRPDSLAVGLRLLGEVLRRRLDPPAWDAVQPVLAHGVEVAAAPAPAAAAPPPADDPLRETRDLFRAAILAGNRRAASGIALETLRTGLGIPRLYLEVFQRAMYEIGELWETNRITVAEEHMATAITQYVLGEVYEHVPLAAVERGCAVVTGIEGELHQIGANMVADILESDGWDVRFLGANVPFPGVVKAIGEHGASVLGVSATMLFNMPRVADLVRDVRAAHGDRVKIVVGGAAFRHSPDAARRVGADGYAPDLASAVETVRGVTGQAA